MLYGYRAEPLRPALIMIAVVLIAAVAIETESARLLILTLLSGPLAWAILQRLRRGRGVRVEADGLTVQFNIRRRAQPIVFSQIQAYQFTQRGQLALAYIQARHTPPGDEARPPRLRLLVTAALADPDALKQALPAANSLSTAQLGEMLTWRRVRQPIYGLLLVFVGIPALVFVLLRLAGAFGIRL